MPNTPPEPARREIKYVVDEMLAPHLECWLQAHHAAFLVPYPARWVNNIYFDTPDYLAYAQNLAGITDRAKVRYRWYGDVSPIGAGQIEVKMRRSGLGRKLTHDVSTPPPAYGMWGAVLTHLRDSITGGARTWFDAFPMPVLINRYRRSYWVTADGLVRVTIDTNHAVFDQRYNSVPRTDRPANVPRTTVFEVKYLPEHHDQVRDTIATLPVSLSRHSKFAVGMDAIRSF